MLTAEGIKYVRNFIGEPATRVGFYTYMTRQTVNNIEAGRNDHVMVRKVLTDYLMKRFEEIGDDDLELRGKMASAGYRCDTKEFKRFKLLESL